MKLKARQHVDHPRYGPGTTLEDGGKRTTYIFGTSASESFPPVRAVLPLSLARPGSQKDCRLKLNRGISVAKSVTGGIHQPSAVIA